ncbi:AMP-binding protein [Thalassospira mesophila]|uniref:Uncharacterized protein n=1 Tax=Thalassospira mesophila TaxID=1293891 RepID=A0A1Y2KZP9_9PROT|nr:AMP-binding protein [Thalassospira mesophila]OSQ38315.1 hypothetical protein TMES_10580 [Thalassospira mesophila]
MTAFLTALMTQNIPDAPLCIEGETCFRRDQVRADIHRLAHYINQSGATYIALHCHSARLFLTGLAAIWQAGCHAVLPASDKAGYLDEIASQFDLFLDDGKINHTLACNTPASSGDNAVLPASENCHATFYTSGSTGAPKAITKTLSQLEAEMAMQTPLWQTGLKDDARILGLVSHQHIYGLLFRVIWPVMTGRVFVATQARFWEDIIADLKTGDIIIASPAHLQRLHPDLATAPRPARLFCSGGPLDQPSAAQSQAAFGIWPTEILGSTETGGIAWRQQTTTDAPWAPFPEVKTALNDLGCLMVAARHIDGANWHHTEDRAVFDATENSHRFRLRGRTDRVVKIEGKRISLSRVEAHLKNHDWVDDAVALLPDETDKRLAAIVVLTPQGQTRLNELGTFRTGQMLRSHITRHEDDAALPRRWRFVASIPTDSQGKKPLHDLRALFDKSATPETIAAAMPVPSRIPAAPTEPALFPTILARSVENDLARIEMRMEPGLLYFKGHFDGSPVLPGVVQLHWAVHYARGAFDIVITLHEITQLKYRKVITPTDQIHLLLQCDRIRGQVKFTYAGTDTDYSSGIIKYSKAD